jgi:hypothetical protein
VIRLARSAAGVYAYAIFLLVVVVASAWFAFMGAVVGVIQGLEHFPGLGALGAAAVLAAFLAVHPERIPTTIRKAQP